MIDDTAIPDALGSLPSVVSSSRRVFYTSARWTGEALRIIGGHLASAGGRALSAIGDDELLAAWVDTVATFRDPSSAVRRSLDDPLRQLTGLSPRGLEAALEAVLGGVAGERAEEVILRSRGPRRSTPVLVVLAATIPGLVVQPLLPILALRRPALVKSSTREPLFAAAFARSLVSRLPALGDAVAALAWPGGEEPLDAAAAESAGPVIVYGGGSSVAAWRGLADDRVLDYGPKTSIGAVGATAELRETARGLARDVALFDQRGCLSVQAVYAEGETAAPLGRELGRALEELADELPPGRTDPVEASRVQQLRSEAIMRGLAVHELALDVGTVIVDPIPDLRPSPGLRTVRVHPVSDLELLPGILEGWSGRLQGVAVAGAEIEGTELGARLRRLGVTRIAPAGSLQHPDTRWHNGGRDLLEVLRGLSPSP